MCAGSFVLSLLGLGVSPAEAGINNCSEGTWNYRQTVTGGCSYGNIVRAGTGTDRRLDFNVTVHDLANDEHCVYLKVTWWYDWASSADVTSKRGMTCGYGEVTPVQQDAWFNNYDFIQVRVCRQDGGADTCSSYNRWHN